MQKQSAISSLKSLAAAHADLSWIKCLTGDPKTSDYAPNKVSREVFSGHYVLVRPTPLPSPELIHVSSSLLDDIGLSESSVTSDPYFLNYFSGNIPLPSSSSPLSTSMTTSKEGSNSSSSGSSSDNDTTNVASWGTTWATPYALSIYGQEMYDNCPFKSGNGYGDGRAISIGEIGPLPWNGQRYEFQLKGAGTTPFCRGGDGRAVLRSSVREFLASEAMHHLGVKTTRALSLIVSQTETVNRPWYDDSKSSSNDIEIPTLDDPRLQRVPVEYRSMFIQQLIQQARNPTKMITEKCAITCRVASSFLRVGHIELFSRRVKQNSKNENAIKELKEIVNHMLLREYKECNTMTEMLHSISNNFAQLTANWIRVGYCQGNFNSDNCLVGKTEST